MNMLLIPGGNVTHVGVRAAQMHETTLASSHSVQIERTFKWRVARTFNSDALLKARCDKLWSAHNQHNMSLPCSPPGLHTTSWVALERAVGFCRVTHFSHYEVMHSL